MKLFLKLSGLIDAMSERICKMVMWLVLVMTLLSSFNAMMRYTINYSSNAWLEMQWYIFAAVFMLMAGYGLLRNAHIRIDVLAGHFPHKVQGWIDIICFFLFFTPMVVGIFYLSMPMVIDSITIGEMSPSPGGLVRWPVRVILPLGLLLLFIQGISEVIKKIAYITGHLPDPYAHEHEMTEEEKLAADLKAEQEKKGAQA